jgi:hypothetical protein
VHISIDPSSSIQWVEVPDGSDEYPAGSSSTSGVLG